MKVLLIDVNCKYSSTGKIVYDLYQRLRADGHKAAICYGRGELIEEPNIYKIGYDLETKVHALFARLTGLNGYFSYFSTKRLISIIDEFQPDVIHIHELHAYFVNIYSLIGHIKKMGVKVVWTFHCEYMYTGKCGHAYECTNYQEGCGNCPAVKEYPKSLLFDKTSKMWQDKYKMLKDMNFTIVTPSQWLADRVKTSFLKHKRIKVIHNGIDTENMFFPRSKEEIAIVREKYDLNGKKVVLAVAPNIMSESKGGRIVVEIANTFWDKNVQFVLVGADDTKRIAENIQLISRTKDQKELAVWYSLADVFLICSKRENFPTTCLEAFSCGTPVVGIDEGGAKETVPGDYGIFCSNDVKVLSEAINTQLNNTFDRCSVACYGKELYSKDKMYQNYYLLYKSL